MGAALPPLAAQAERLIATGLCARAGLAPEELRDLVRDHARDALLVVAPRLLPPSTTAPLLERDGKPGFVVEDMTDLDEFAPIPGARIPDAPVYLVEGLDRGDDLAGWSPEDALPELTARGRLPLTVAEGIQWVLQRPDVLERNRCFMTIASRKARPGGGVDARTPALWISNGTGRDGAPRRGAAKVGWCWARNHHSWLGFASASARIPA